MAGALATFETQPDFPGSDLSEVNAEYVRYLFKEQGRNPLAALLNMHQHGLFLRASEALEYASHRVKIGDDSYGAFVHGFADLELIATMVQAPQAPDIPRAAANASAVLFGSNEDLAMVSMADRIGSFQDTMENATGVIIEQGLREGDTMPLLHARLLGAQIASELRL